MKKIKLKPNRLTGFKVSPASIARASYALSSGILLASAVLFILISVFNPSLFKDVRRNVMDVAAPVLSALYQPVYAVSSFVRDVSGLAHMQQQISRLEAENKSLKASYYTLLPLEIENKALRAAAGFKGDVRLKPVMSAAVVSDLRGAYSKSFLIAAGQSDGVRADMAVSYDGVLVGRVIEAGEHSARVLMMTDLNMRVPVLVDLGDKGIKQAVLRGRNDGLPQIDYLDARLAPGQQALVVTSGMGGVYPRGLPVGRLVAPALAGGSGALTVKPVAYDVEPFMSPGSFLNISLHKLMEDSLE